MARADYDYNIWSDMPSQLTLTAYQQYYDASDDNWIRTNTDKYFSIHFQFPEHNREIEYLLGDLYINQYPLTDYDDWVDNVFLFANDAPPMIRNFMDNLPNYQMETRNAKGELVNV
jgi:hypothetical protein